MALVTLEDFNESSKAIVYPQAFKEYGEKIKLAFQALADQPEFAGQLDRDALYKSYSTDPKKYQSRYESGLDNQITKIEQLGKDAKSDPQKTKELKLHCNNMVQLFIN